MSAERSTTPEPAGRPPPYDLVALAASAGGLHALDAILSALPAGFPVPVAIVQHRSASHPNLLPTLLSRQTRLVVKLVEDGELLRQGTVYLAPPDRHMLVRADRTVALRDGRKVRHVRSSADPLFISAAEAFGGRVIAVVLTGGDGDGTDGVRVVKAAGGVVIAQDEATSEHFSMPRSAIETGCVDHVLALRDIPAALLGLVTSPPIPVPTRPAPAGGPLAPGPAPVTPV